MDVTRGSNTVSFALKGKSVTVQGYSAGPGYDLVTGVGTIDAARFILNGGAPAPGRVRVTLADVAVHDPPGGALTTETSLRRGRHRDVPHRTMRTVSPQPRRAA